MLKPKDLPYITNGVGRQLYGEGGDRHWIAFFRMKAKIGEDHRAIFIGCFLRTMARVNEKRYFTRAIFINLFSLGEPGNPTLPGDLVRAQRRSQQGHIILLEKRGDDLSVCCTTPRNWPKFFIELVPTAGCINHNDLGWFIR